MITAYQTRRAVDSDWDQIAELVNLYEHDGLTGEILLARERRAETDAPRLQLVSLHEDRIVGHARSLRRHSDPVGKFSVMVYVHPDLAGQGLGRELLDRAEGFAIEGGAKYLMTYVQELCPRGLHFASKAGYEQIQHLFESVLSLDLFDPQSFLMQQKALEAEGYRVVTLAELGDNEANRRKIYELDTETDVDTPGYENWGLRSYEQYDRDELKAFGFNPESVFIVVKDGQWIAMHSIRRKPVEGIMSTDYTGVQREHRGKGLAQLLKGLGLAYAKNQGMEMMQTNNDERNAPMLAVNRKFGFVAKPGFYIYKKGLRK